MVVFHSPEKRQHAGVAPLVVAPFRPAVVVLRYSPVQNLPVDGRGAARGLAPRDHQVGLLRRHPGVVRPTVRAVGRKEHVVAQLQIIRQVVEVGVIRPRLQQQHALVRVFREAGGNGGSGPSRRRPQYSRIASGPPNLIRHPRVIRHSGVISSFRRKPEIQVTAHGSLAAILADSNYTGKKSPTLMRTRFTAGKRQNQNLRDFMIWQDWEISITERFQS